MRELSPGIFRSRVRPYLPGTVLELCRLWPHARKRGFERGQQYLVGPYCPSCGPELVWLFRQTGEIECTADRPWDLIQRPWHRLRESLAGLGVSQEGRRP